MAYIKIRNVKPDINNKLIAKSLFMKDFVRQLKSSAEMDDLHIFIAGETGTGKSEFARYFHQQSSRKDNPFVVTSASMIEPGLLRSELFGHERGAFTNANERHLGLLEQANNGILFFDEIGDLSLDEQRALKFSYMEDTIIHYRRVGGEKTLSSNVRFVTAYSQSLHSLVEEKKFLREVWSRFGVYQLKLLPLRKRHDDLEALIHLFLTELSDKRQVKIKEISYEAMDALMRYGWPRNIREVKSSLVSVIFKVSPNSTTIELEDVLPFIGNEALDSDLRTVFEEAFKLWPLDFIKALKDYVTIKDATVKGKTKKEIADILNIGRTSLFNKEKRLAHFDSEFEKNIRKLDDRLNP